jgi:hypothetical protein
MTGLLAGPKGLAQGYNTALMAHRKDGFGPVYLQGH